MPMTWPVRFTSGPPISLADTDCRRDCMSPVRVLPSTVTVRFRAVSRPVSMITASFVPVVPTAVSKTSPGMWYESCLDAYVLATRVSEFPTATVEKARP